MCKRHPQPPTDPPTPTLSPSPRLPTLANLETPKKQVRASKTSLQLRPIRLRKMTDPRDHHAAVEEVNEVQTKAKKVQSSVILRMSLVTPSLSQSRLATPSLTEQKTASSNHKLYFQRCKASLTGPSSFACTSGFVNSTTNTAS